MHLWQIRQFPNQRQDRCVRHTGRRLFIFAILCTVSLSAQAQNAPPAEPADPAAPATSSALDILFQEALEKLKSRRSIQAKLIEQVSINDQPVRLTGRYVSEGNKVRLELSVDLGGDAQGSLLEVSDGDILWNETVIAENRQVSLRNLKQIAAALAEQTTPPAASWDVELGLGGLTGLMSSLDRTMNFDQLREAKEGDRKFIVVQGKWKPDVAEKLRRIKDQPLPSYIPDSVRVYFDPETLFPQRFLYLKRNPEQKTSRPLVRLEFEDVQLDAPVDDSLFQFEQPTDIVPEDITQQYIDQLTRRNEPPTDAETQPAAK